jgi:hypothetical protein
MELKFKIGDLVQRTVSHAGDKIYIGEKYKIIHINYIYGKITSIQLDKKGDKNYNYTATYFKLIYKTHELWI